MNCVTFKYTRASDPLLYDCIDACEEAYFSESRTNSVTRTSGEWTVIAISGTWFSTPQRVADYVKLDIAIAAEAMDSIRTHPFYKAVRQAVLDVIRDNPTMKLALTGHSAGGCVAALIAVEVQTMCECTCIGINPYLNTNICNSLLASVTEKLGILLFFTVKDITVPLVRPIIPMLEDRGWMRWVIPNFKDSDVPPIHILAANFKGRDSIIAYSDIESCLASKLTDTLAAEDIPRLGTYARAGMIAAVTASLVAIAYQNHFVA